MYKRITWLNVQIIIMSKIIVHLLLQEVLAKFTVRNQNKNYAELAKHFHQKCKRNNKFIRQTGFSYFNNYFFYVNLCIISKYVWPIIIKFKDHTVDGVSQLFLQTSLISYGYNILLTFPLQLVPVCLLNTPFFFFLLYRVNCHWK